MEIKTKILSNRLIQKRIQSLNNLFICSLQHTHTHTQESASYEIYNIFKLSFDSKGFYYTKFTSLKGVFYLCKTNLAPNWRFYN